MTIYAYKALTADGGRASGTIEAASRREAGEALRARGVHVTSIRASDRRALGGRRRVSSQRFRQTFLFTSFMRRLLRAGMPVVEALDSAGSELKEYAVGAAVGRVKNRVAGGSGLAEALSHEGEFFDELYAAMIRSAESSGTLAMAFDTIHRYEVRKREFRRRIFSALAYPIVLVAVSILVVGFLLSYVIPKITDTLVSANVPLPFVTRVLIAVGEIARVWWGVPAGILILAFFAPRILRSFPAGRRLFDTALVRAPLMGRFARSAVLARFSRTLAALLRSGLRVADALEIGARVSGNHLYERAVETARSRIISGADLAGALGGGGLFPGYALQIVGIGERTGGLADSFEEIAVSEEEALEVTAERFLTLLEPAIIVVMAVVVGFIVASVLLPILSISNIA